LNQRIGIIALEEENYLDNHLILLIFICFCVVSAIECQERDGRTAAISHIIFNILQVLMTSIQ
jgi:Na+/phosphate symporter